ncbi:homeobox protein Hox-B7-A-like [Amyelois transitella]|uniref:homeobox protein Hox-B7-A-like n=1 Tax=Amyelois transitella TaxID=680683 RepID=UPI00298F455F|nr:homeobox protein Hox-B7-A-like [Amyelois transitella]
MYMPPNGSCVTSVPNAYPNGLNKCANIQPEVTVKLETGNESNYISGSIHDNNKLQSINYVCQPYYNGYDHRMYPELINNTTEMGPIIAPNTADCQFGTPSPLSSSPELNPASPLNGNTFQSNSEANNIIAVPNGDQYHDMDEVLFYLNELGTNGRSSQNNSTQFHGDVIKVQNTVADIKDSPGVNSAQLCQDVTRESTGGYDPDHSKKMAAGTGDNIVYDWMKGAGGDKKKGAKRTRQTYTRHQTLELEKEFHFSNYVNRGRRAQVSKAVGLTERQIKIWFQNRRMKAKKDGNLNTSPDPNAISGNIGLAKIQESRHQATGHFCRGKYDHIATMPNNMPTNMPQNYTMPLYGNMMPEIRTMQNSSVNLY